MNSETKFRLPPVSEDFKQILSMPNNKAFGLENFKSHPTIEKWQQRRMQ